ncbi:hypothetical protein [Nostoc sp.]|uniref:hypothetical protein n=1 Tax=Nostoc sp. TaxID=1180 RepID=UPI002FF9D8E7
MSSPNQNGFRYFSLTANRIKNIESLPATQGAINTSGAQLAVRHYESPIFQPTKVSGYEIQIT